LCIKRVSDIVLSSLALIILAPILLITFVAIKIDDPLGSPIFSQIRTGKNGKAFTLYKFRSMVINAEDILPLLQDKNEMDGPVFKIKNDPRITRIGRFIRHWSIDELPQLLNVIKGDMSIVGPRPPLPNEVKNYSLFEFQRLLVKPGLTCFWQVSGRNKIGFDQWVRLDLKYIQEQSLRLDGILLLKTIPAVFKRDGAE
jgi:lipopolysaccharide/colanic/teichoic acid biosynthesis glycosyltransferase